VVGADLAGEDAALSDDGNMLSRELLFQLTDQALLDPVEGGEQPEGHVDDDSLAASADIDLRGGGDEQVLKVSLHVGLNLEVEDGTSHELLKSIGLGTTLLADLVTSADRRHPAIIHHNTSLHCFLTSLNTLHHHQSHHIAITQISKKVRIQPTFSISPHCVQHPVSQYIYNSLSSIPFEYLR
jgi:hypothetical protein